MPLHDWTQLNKSKRQLLDDLLVQWKALLDDETAKEGDYQRFLEAHSGLFFSAPGTHIVLSKPEMAGAHIPDLVIVSDNESYGFKYEFIELESPHDRTFNAKGTQAVALTDALQQVEDWKRWLAKYPELVDELFPSKAHKVWGDPQVSFSVVIGRRADMERDNEVRIQKATLYGCAIRSFDHLTDRLRKQHFFNELFAETDSALTEEETNEIASPFFRAMSSSEWKSFLSHKPFAVAHSVGWNGKALVKHRPLNSDLLAKFVAMRGDPSAS